MHYRNILASVSHPNLAALVAGSRSWLKLVSPAHAKNDPELPILLPASAS